MKDEGWRMKRGYLPFSSFIPHPSAYSRRGLISQHLRRRGVEIVILLSRDRLDQSLHYRVALHPFRFGVEVGDDAVSQHGDRNLANIFRAHVITTFQERPGFA